MRCCKECGDPLPEKLKRRHEKLCYRCRNARYRAPGPKTFSRTSERTQYDEPLIRRGLTDLEWGIVKHAARLMADYQLFQVEEREGRAPGKRLRKSEQPETADSYIARQVQDVRRQCTLLSRTCEYANLMGWFTSNAYNKKDWAAHMARQTTSKVSA